MNRPLKLFAYRLGRELKLDVDVVMSWPLDKLYEYMAFTLTENDEWKEQYKEESMTPEQRTQRLLNVLRQ